MYSDTMIKFTEESEKFHVHLCAPIAHLCAPLSLIPVFQSKGLARRDIARGEPRKFALTYPGSGRWWHLDHRSTPTSFAAPGRAVPHPAAADGCIPHHLDRFIARHGHGSGGRGSRKRVKEGEKAHTGEERYKRLASWLAGWLVGRLVCWSAAVQKEAIVGSRWTR